MGYHNLAYEHNLLTWYFIPKADDEDSIHEFARMLRDHGKDGVSCEWFVIVNVTKGKPINKLYKCRGSEIYEGFFRINEVIGVDHAFMKFVQKQCHNLARFTPGSFNFPDADVINVPPKKIVWVYEKDE